MKLIRLRALAILSTLVVFAPLSAAEPAPAVAPLRVLFLGNSLTYVHEVPALVQAMALLGGREIEVMNQSSPDYALEDHWNTGAQRLLKKKQPWDVVVMQQGASTLPASREHLKLWTKRWADLARSTGTRPALYMVWPMSHQRQGFLLASNSYREAAAAAGTEIYPAAEAWALVMSRQPKLRLFADDGLHANESGAFLAAMAIARGLTGLDPALVPAKVKLKSGRVVRMSEENLALFRAAVAELQYH